MKPSVAAFAVMFLCDGGRLLALRALGKIAVKYDSQA